MAEEVAQEDSVKSISQRPASLDLDDSVSDVISGRVNTEGPVRRRFMEPIRVIPTVESSEDVSLEEEKNNNANVINSLVLLSNYSSPERVDENRKSRNAKMQRIHGFQVSFSFLYHIYFMPADRNFLRIEKM